MSDIPLVMTPEEKADDLKARITAFRDGMVKLSQDMQINIRPQMTADGMILSLFDAKSNTPVVQDTIK